MAIIDLKANPISGWEEIVADNYAYVPYWWIRGVNSDSRKALMQQALDESLSSENTLLVGYLSDEEDLLGFACARKLDWDSDHFGFQIWRLDHLGTWDGPQEGDIAKALVQASLRAAHGKGCENVQANVPIGNLPAVHALEDSGFRTMEIQTIWLFDLNRSPLPLKSNHELVRDFRAADTEQLIKLASTVYDRIPHRSHADPHFSTKATNGLWTEWIRNACSGQLADHIAVAESNGDVIGYSTMTYHGDHRGLSNARVAELGLGAMSPSFRNKGIVTDVVIHQLEWLKAQGGDACFVGTQANNIPPQRVWLRIGFKPATMRLTLHHWRRNVR